MSSNHYIKDTEAFDALFSEQPKHEMTPEEIEDHAFVTCPQCKKKFVLIWDADYDEKLSLAIRACPSGGVYDVAIKCPHCDYDESL